MEWLYYLLEANLYLLLFYGFYRLLLAKTTFYSINRYYLILSSITAFILPVLQLGILNPAPIVDNAKFPPPMLYTAEQLASIALTPAKVTVDYSIYLYYAYLFIAMCFTVNLAFSILKIVRLWLKAKKQTSGNVTLIELNEEKSAFSFFNLLFIHPHLAEKQAVLRHEMVHIKQKHSLDILLFEFIQIASWFNPITYLLKRDIKIIHEYIADEQTTSSDLHKHEYALFLIENSFGIIPQRLTNHIFNQSILKRRINMLNKKRTTGWARLRLLLVLPLSLGMLCTSTMAFTKDYGFVDLLPEKSKFVKTVKIILPQEKKTYFPKYSYGKNNNYISLERRIIVINGKAIADNNKYYGTREAERINFLNTADAIKKYGAEKGKYGAVEIIGKDAVNTYPPPIVIEDKNRVPRLDQDGFFPMRSVNKDGKISYDDKRYIVINGQPITDVNSFFGITNAKTILKLNNLEARKKYGTIANYGAVEINGNELKYIKSIADGPPPPLKTVVKFPPPIVKPDGENLKTPPPVEPPPPGYKSKKDQIKFPPPIIKPDTKNKKTPPAVVPPPPKKDVVRFPPPIIKKDTSKVN